MNPPHPQPGVLHAGFFAPMAPRILKNGALKESLTAAPRKVDN